MTGTMSNQSEGARTREAFGRRMAPDLERPEQGALESQEENGRRRQEVRVKRQATFFRRASCSPPPSSRC